MRYVSTSQGTYVREIVTIYAISFAFRVEKGVLLEVCFGSTTEIVYIGNVTCGDYVSSFDSWRIMLNKIVTFSWD